MGEQGKQNNRMSVGTEVGLLTGIPQYTARIESARPARAWGWAEATTDMW